MKLPSSVAGKFYPAHPQKLLDQFKAFEQIPSKRFEHPIEALLLPHAGYEYSGAIAAQGYRSIASAQTVVVIGPSHYFSFEGASLFPGKKVETPLGDLGVDQESCDFLTNSSSSIAWRPKVFAGEHSVEVHFPMIQYYFSGAQVVPVILGQGDSTSVQPLVEALLKLRQQKSFLLIASSDLSHYPSYETARETDKAFLEALLSMDETQVARTDKKIMAKKYPNHYCTHCGKEPVLALLRYAKALGTREAKMIAYQNSGDVTGDHSRVVGYAAVALGRD